uniref:Putative LAGLIDADG homing endonuclease n=1 Tax=Rhexinema sarcinoideum TaxID=43261 RepID=A0A1B2RYQ8_9CHLO|nr:putative LAGLIDADG homing endonuclease [Rhexinema sarcinoideum]
MRQNQKISSRARALLGVEVHKKNKTGFFSSTWQAKQGKKGGQKTGRSNGVLTRQGKIMRETLKRTTYWECFYPISNLKLQKNSQIKLKKTALNPNGFCKGPLDSKKMFFYTFSINFQETFTNLVNLLRAILPKEIKDVSLFAKVARGQRLSSYG